VRADPFPERCPPTIDVNVALLDVAIRFAARADAAFADEFVQADRRGIKDGRLRWQLLVTVLVLVIRKLTG
jgi:hypothetical protein